MTDGRAQAVIGVDGRSLAGRPTGVGRYLANLLRSLAPLEPGLRFRLYVPGKPPDLPGTIEPRTLRMPPGPLDNVFTWNHLRIPMHLMRDRVDLLHCPFYTMPMFCPAPAVVTIHDITFDLHPEWYTRRARFSFGRFAAFSARRARHVLTVSECSRRDIIRTYGVRPDRVTAVPLAPAPEFVPVTDPERLAAVGARYDLPGPYILHVGSITPRRNIDRLLDAFAVLRREARDMSLLLAGSIEPPAPPVDVAVRRRGLGDAVRVAGYVDSADLPALYSGATAVACPSLYEGFGLPVLEAMACGAPVLASSTSCFPEVVGDAGMMVDPEDTDAIARGLIGLVSDRDLRGRLRRAGIERASRFTWERTARGTLEVYRRALGMEGAAAAAGAS